MGKGRGGRAPAAIAETALDSMATLIVSCLDLNPVEPSDRLPGPSGGTEG